MAFQKMMKTNKNLLSTSIALSVIFMAGHFDQLLAAQKVIKYRLLSPVLKNEEHQSSIYKIWLSPHGKKVFIEHFSGLQVNNILYDKRLSSMALSENEENFAFANSHDVSSLGMYVDGNKYVLLHKGKKIREYKPYDPNFSGDGSKISFSYHVPKDGTYVKVGDSLYGPFISASRTYFNYDGSMFGFAYKEESIYGWCCNSSFGGIVRFCMDPSSAFKINIYGGVSDYDHYVEQGIYVRIKDKTYGKYYGVRGPEISSDGKVFAFSYTDKMSFPNRNYIHVNDKKYGPFAYLFYNTIISRNGKLFGFRYIESKMKLKKEDNYLRIKDKIYGPYEFIKYMSTTRFLQVSPESRVLRCNIISDRGYDNPKFSYENPVFSENGDSYCFSFKKNDSFYIQFNDLTYGPFNEFRIPILSYDGSKIAFVIEGKYGRDNTVVINGRTYGPFLRLDKILIDNRGTRFGILYTKEISKNDGLGKNIHKQKFTESYMNINGKEFGPFKWMCADFTITENQRLIYAYSKGEYVYVVESD